MGKTTEGFIAGVIVTALVIGVVWSQATGATVGISLTHNNKPVDNLYVKAYCYMNTNAEYPANSGTTDGTGKFTFWSATWNQCNGDYAYVFTYNGTQSIIRGPNQAVAAIEV